MSALLFFLWTVAAFGLLVKWIVEGGREWRERQEEEKERERLLKQMNDPTRSSSTR